MVEAVERVTEEVSTEALRVCRRGAVSKVLSMESGMDMVHIQRQIVHLSKQDPSKIGGRGRMGVRIVLLMDHLVIGITTGIKAGHPRDRLLRATLET